MAPAAATRTNTSTDLHRYALALLHALAREEAAGRRPQRLTEPGLATWQRFRGRLGPADLLRLLAEDGGVVHALPFDPRRVGEVARLDGLEDSLVEDFLAELPELDPLQAAPAYLEDQARRLGVSSKLARAELHQMKPHQRVLELPGTGAQLCHHLVTTQPTLKLQQNCAIACEGWAELTLAGIVALDLAAPNSDFISAATPEDLKNPEHPLRQQRFDFVVGLRPDKGGQFRIDDQLAIWFHGAKVVLV